MAAKTLVALHQLRISLGIARNAEGFAAPSKARTPLAITISEDGPDSAASRFGTDLACFNRQQLSLFVSELGLLGISWDPLVEVSQPLINTRAPVVQ
jgi:hypothetical protein